MSLKADQRISLPKAFTLIELLVVITIIAILLAILLPTLLRARYEAKMTVCMSSQRQLAVGLLAFADDHANYYPGASPRQDVFNHKEFRVGSSWTTNLSLRQLFTSTSESAKLRPYFGSADGTRAKIEQCPLAPSLDESGYNGGPSKAPDYLSSYMFYFNMIYDINVAKDDSTPGAAMQQVGDIWKKRHADSVGFHTLVSDPLIVHGANKQITTNHDELNSKYRANVWNQASWMYMADLNPKPPRTRANFAMQDGSVSNESYSLGDDGWVNSGWQMIPENNVAR